MTGNGADAILRSLEAEGVDVVFGLPGGAILPTYDAFGLEGAQDRVGSVALHATASR